MTVFNYRPDRPIAQRVTIDLPAFGNGPQQPAIFDTGRGHPCIDSLLDPDWDGDGADGAAFALQVGQHPPPFPLLDGFDVEFGVNSRGR